MFNEGQYWRRVQAGELFQKIIHKGTPDPQNNQPPGTMTVTIAIREGSEDGPTLAEVHGFIEPGWVIGASGKLDPKRIWKDGKVYRIRTDTVG